MLYYDKLANKEPYTRAKDLEDKLKSLGTQRHNVTHKVKDTTVAPGAHRDQTKAQSEEYKRIDGWYNNRVGEMGEFAFMAAASAACKETPGHPFLIITAYDIHKNLWERKANNTTKEDGTLKKLNIDFESDVKKDLEKYLQDKKSGAEREHDTLLVVPNGDKIDILCCQTKVIKHGNEKEAIKKVQKSLEQAVIDVFAFLAILPDLTPDQIASRINFKLFSILPATSEENCPDSALCRDCKNHIIFREDIQPGADRNPVSVSDDLYESIHKQNTISSHHSLRTKLGMENLSPPSKEVEALFRTISTRYVGLGSLYPTKDRTVFLQKVISQLNKMDSFGGDMRALYLSPEQMSAIQNLKMIICGMYGTGKTVVIEFVVQKILETINNPHIYLVAWEESHLLMDRFNKLKKNTQDSAIKIMSGDEVCKKFGVFQEQYKHEEQRDVVINTICRKLEEECPPDHQPFLLIDELPPNTKGSEAFSGDWRGLRPGKVGLVLSLMPKADQTTPSKYSIDIKSPPDMPVVTLTRVYRYTHSILNFFRFLMEDSTGDLHSPLCIPENGFSYGHEVSGQLPEVMLLPRTVRLNASSAEDLLEANKAALFKILETFGEKSVTVLVDTCVVEEEIRSCVGWLQKEVVGGRYPGIQVSTPELFRGLESGILVWIADRAPTWEYFDSLSRVTAHLVILYKPREEDEFERTLLRAVQQKKAKLWHPTM